MNLTACIFCAYNLSAVSVAAQQTVWNRGWVRTTRRPITRATSTTVQYERRVVQCDTRASEELLYIYDDMDMGGGPRKTLKSNNKSNKPDATQLAYTYTEPCRSWFESTSVNCGPKSSTYGHSEADAVIRHVTRFSLVITFLDKKTSKILTCNTNVLGGRGLMSRLCGVVGGKTLFCKLFSVKNKN